MLILRVTQREESSLILTSFTSQKYMGLPVTCRPWAKSRWSRSCRTYILVLLKKNLLHQHCSSLEFWFLLLWTPCCLMSHPKEENMDPQSALWTSVSAFRYALSILQSWVEFIFYLSYGIASVYFFWVICLLVVALYSYNKPNEGRVVPHFLILPTRSSTTFVLVV